MELIDSHCHIDFIQFDEDRAEVLAEAAKVGVKQIINPGTNLESSQRAIKLTQQYPNIYAAIGFHPYDANAVNAVSLSTLKDLAREPKVVAIGEIGLDYYRDHTPKKVQYQAFEDQLTLAQTLNLPVIIHQREASEDTMAILKQWAASGSHSGLVLHSFSGDKAMIDMAVSLGFYMGIGGPITFKNAKSYPDLVRQIPLNNLIVETDAPFLSPHPFRGKRNEPARILLIAQKLADIFEMALNPLAQQLTKNTQTLFRLPTPVSTKSE